MPCEPAELRHRTHDRREERLIALKARSTNGGRRPGRRSARLLAADLSSYALRAPVARHIRQTPAVARLLHCSSRGGAAPAKLVTGRAAGCSQSTWTGDFQACQRCLTLSAGHRRASATVHTQRNGVGAIPAHRLIRPWAAPGPPSRHLPHSLATHARAAHDFPSFPFVIQDISWGATRCGRPSTKSVSRRWLDAYRGGTATCIAWSVQDAAETSARAAWLP